MQVIDPESKAYLDSLREAREALVAEGGRTEDVALLDDYLRRVDSGESIDDLVVVPIERVIEVEVETPVSPNPRKAGGKKRQR